MPEGSNATDGLTVVEDRTLNPIEFRVPATDTRGHTNRMYFRCQPGHSHQVVVCIESKRYPYRTKGDLLRHAMARHLRWLEVLAPIPSVTAEVDAILDIMRDEEFNNEFQLVFEKLSERINSHMGQGAVGEARRLLLQVQGRIGRMPDGYWKDKYHKEIDDRWGHIIKDAPKASLRVKKEE